MILPALLHSFPPRTWLFYGDSITHGVLHTAGARCFSEHFTERLRFELERPDDVVLNTACSGHNTRQMLSHFPLRVARFKPDVLLLMAGMNDCNSRLADGQYVPLDEFCANLASMISAVRGWGGEVILQTVTPVLPDQAPERELTLPQYNAAMRSLAAELAVPLIDHAAVWEALAAKLPAYMADAFHPNAYGHILLAYTLFRALGVFDEAAPSCGLYLP